MIMQKHTHHGTGPQTITPAQAEMYLKLNRQNRKFSERNVERLMRAMNNSQWKFNGETIKIGIDEDGKEILLDGQHRLTACVRAGKPFVSYIISGLDPDVFDTIDSGKRRSLADVYSTMGCKNCSLLASSILMVDQYTVGRLGLSNKNEYPNDIAGTLLDLYPEIVTSAALIDRIKKTLPFSGAALCAGHYIFAQIDVQQADDFAVKMSKGIGLEEDSPIRHFREQMIRDRSKRNIWNRHEILGSLIKVWNHVRFARPMTRSVNKWVPGTAPQPVAK
tara:strand:+ start:2959 stop:3789 length:831 start_codon:yes stop_codon:yes gene_type:complete